ncbi:hypothetical protein [Empedobacter stercoris]|uniref:hypothetical protein n=1 Tax=Empedobacter stercoris TaxID=1628248 RepID=UPI0039EB9F64
MDKKETIKKLSQSIEFFTIHLEDVRKFNRIKNLLENQENFSKYFFLNDIETILTISQLDLAVNAKNLINTKKKWEIIFFSKNSYLVIYETINAFTRINKFLYENTKNHEELKETFQKCTKELRNFKNEFEFQTTMNYIRNKTSGHIHEDLDEYYKIVNNLDAEKTANMILKFLDLISLFQQMITSIMSNQNLTISEELSSRIKKYFANN